ncbi:DoxX family protein [Nocardia otitidiscaviarum]|uniref:DoxX family protein n=1 Tax=Nocardia otitidiscaviarum TaxID=1823 RepID=UPI0004A747D0|nr:DoxX family protein [Nocardia otitidiscaviarum]MBF6135066.1 DoxX family protein [Nocardia otitidiscaviarum]MBF6486889.1 DoxX family protein [Nocardia otitidiscaviarum]
MAPLIALIVVTGLSRLAGLLGVGWLDSWPHAVRIGLATMFLLTASAHFTQPKRDALIAMVPPTFPNAAAMITLTGVLEAAGAGGLLLPPVAPVAALCLAALLIVMFPANIRAARTGGGVKTMPLPARTVVQGVFLGACVLAAF